jgi:DNA-binding SARP family transcriptional activator
LATDDLQRVARHLAAATDGPDDAVAAVLVDAAQATAVSESIDLYERSALLWVDPEDSAVSLIRGAESAALGGSALRAQSLAERAGMMAGCPSTALRCSHLQGRLALSGVLPIPEGRQVLADALEIAVGTDPDRAVRICLDAVLLSVVVGDRAGAVAIARRGVLLARSDPRAAATADVADVVLAGALAFDGCPVDEVALAEGCARLVSNAGLSPEVVTATEVAMNGLIAQERYRTAASIGNRFVQEARERGSTGAIPLVLALTAKSELYLDDIESAVVRLEEAELLASESHQVFAANYASLWSGIAAALQGNRAGVDRAAQAFSRRVAAIGNSSVGNSIISHAFGHLALSESRTVEAAGHFDDLARYRLAQGAASDGMLRWEGDYVEVLVDVGRTAEAHEQLARLERRLEIAESPWVRVVVALTRALLAPVDEFDAAYRLAVDATGGGFAFARYRTELSWGERLTAAGRPADAVVHLQVAATGFEGVGAKAWAARARRELARARSGTFDATPAPAGHAGPQSARADGPEPSPSRIVVMLGDFVVRGAGPDVHPIGHVGRVIAMVAIRGSGVHVGELANALWPDAPDGVGRTRLRNVLSRSRRLTDSVLRRDGDVVRLVDGIEVDALRFEREGRDALRQAATGDDGAPRTARAALSRFGGELVPSLRYDDWLLAPRERLQRMHIALLDLLADDAQHRGDIDEMLAYLERGIAGDPYDEERYLRAARGLANERRRGPALRIIDRAAAMVEELGIDVDPRLIDLRLELETSR